MKPSSLEERFLAQLEALGLSREPHRLLVAVSGGRDSVVLLHLLRFAAAHLPLSLTAAHFDHRMRPESGQDARWVAGLCRAWGVPLVTGRSRGPLSGEDAARRARHAFLRRAARRAGCDLVALAHHADDQAETVLFRALRGTGVAGLAGMRPRTRAGLVRPLLPFWGEEIGEYAARAGLRWRDDATNAEPGAARNRIRAHLLPLAEREVAPGARRALVRLAELARESETALERVSARAERRLAERDGSAYVLARTQLRAYDSTIAARVLRRVLRRFGVVLGRSGTRAALQFITHAPSGRTRELPRGVQIRTEFDRARIERPLPVPPDLPVTLLPPEGGATAERVGRIGGRGVRVSARRVPGPGKESPERITLPMVSLAPPLLVRGRSAGDRIRTAGGSKPLRKWLMEKRVPRSRRDRLVLLTDAAGEVLWVVGVGRSPGRAPDAGEDALEITVADDA